MYAVVEIDPSKDYSIAEFVGCVRYIGSCNGVKNRYRPGQARQVPVSLRRATFFLKLHAQALPLGSTKCLYVVRVCAFVEGKMVQLFDDNDRLILETFMILHFGSALFALAISARYIFRLAQPVQHRVPA